MRGRQSWDRDWDVGRSRVHLPSEAISEELLDKSGGHLLGSIVLHAASLISEGSNSNVLLFVNMTGTSPGGPAAVSAFPS